MKTLNIIAVANRPPAWAAAAETHYLRQLRNFRAAVLAVRAAGGADKEAAAVLVRLPANCRCVLLERGGKMLNEEQFYAAVNKWLADVRPLYFSVGGADGAGAALRARADFALSLSPLVFPHTLARLILIEQLFRVDCKMRNHPYPR